MCISEELGQLYFDAIVDAGLIDSKNYTYAELKSILEQLMEGYIDKIRELKKDGLIYGHAKKS